MNRYEKEFYKIKIRKPQFGVNLFVLSLFFLSFINVYLLAIFTVLITLFYTIKKGNIGCVESFILIQLRSVLNPGIACTYEGVAVISKWICIFYLSFFIIFRYYLNNSNKKLNTCMRYITFLSIVLILSSLFFSSYPVTASFKVLSYAIPFAAIIIAINVTDKIDWIKYINFYLGLILIGSIVTIPLSVAYLRNGRAFQGIINHPNLYAVLMVIFIAGYLYDNDKYIGVKTFCIVSISFLLITLTFSRTAMISFLIIIVFFLFTMRTTVNTKFFYISIIFVTLLLVYVTNIETFNANIHDYIYKGYSNNILFSRENQFDRNINRFYSSPLFGTGFNVPYVSGFKSYIFSFDLVVENGNLFLAILGDMGIVGSMVCITLYTYIFKNGEGILLFIAPIMISMGEMTFFSTNNIGILLYLYYAIYLRKRKTLSNLI